LQLNSILQESLGLAILYPRTYTHPLTRQEYNIFETTNISDRLTVSIMDSKQEKSDSSVIGLKNLKFQYKVIFVDIANILD
jgi:capsule polysaccharide export protein KpsC/LpsZ